MLRPQFLAELFQALKITWEHKRLHRYISHTHEGFYENSFAHIIFLSFGVEGQDVLINADDHWAEAVQPTCSAQIAGIDRFSVYGVRAALL